MKARAHRYRGAAIPVLLGLALVLPQVAEAGSISGTIVDTAGAPLQGMEVRLWSNPDGKGFAIYQVTTSNASGNYLIDAVEAGSYKLDARMAPGFEGNYADRWYDVEAPNSGGWIAADADIIPIAADEALTGYNLMLPIYGGLDGRVTSGGAAIGGMQVRVERGGDYRIHHNDLSGGGVRLGLYSMRGLVPGTDYRVLVHDPIGNHEDAVLPGPLTVTEASTGSVPAIDIRAVQDDPYEPNDTSASAGAFSVDGDGFRASPPEPWSTDGAHIRPRGSDVDWYCWDALAGDRYIIRTSTLFAVGASDRTNPWVDPLLSLQTPDGTVLRDDDDSGTNLNAELDSLEVAADGTLCAVVSTYGDEDWSGASQMSAGRYELAIEMGNRRPLLSATVAGLPVPTPPTAITIDEGQELVIRAQFEDPDGDSVVVLARHVASGGTVVNNGNFSVGSSTATYTWLAEEGSPDGSPYTLTLSVADGEFTTEIDVLVEVMAVNQPPERPVLLAPPDGAVLDVADVDLRVENASDPDGDALTYELEVYFGALAGAPEERASVEGDESGETSWTVVRIPDNTRVVWRARSFDGNPEDGYSPWTEPWSFAVDTVNQPPLPPVLVKPDEGEVVLMRQPTLSVENTSDPDPGDSVSIVFELAGDTGFTEGLLSSPEVPQNSAGPTTRWTVDRTLDWGGTYYARAYAVDTDGEASDYSEVHQFSIKSNQLPATPNPAQPFGAECLGTVVYDELPESFTVINVADPENEAVTIELQVFRDVDDPDTDVPLVDEVVPQTPDSEVTMIPVDRRVFHPGNDYVLRVRASDGTDHTPWMACRFHVSAEVPADPDDPFNRLPTALRIITPEDGQVFGSKTTQVLVEVENATDEDEVDGGALEVAYCLDDDPDGELCEASPSQWPSVPQSSLSPHETTRFLLDELTPGSYQLTACARDRQGACGSGDSVAFVIEAPSRVKVTPGCECASAPVRSQRLGWALLGLVVAGFAVRRRRGGS